MVNLVRRLEQRLVTRAEENENLIDKMKHGLLVFSHGTQKEEQKDVCDSDTLVLCNLKAESMIKQGKPEAAPLSADQESNQPAPSLESKHLTS